jgi:hypothetical protein
MCDADVGMILTYWVQNRDHPWPDLDTTYKCRNLGDVWHWVKEHQVSVPGDCRLTRPAEATELEVPP